MADAKVRGITIELDGDTTGLSDSLKSVNKEIGQTQKELKDVERLLKMDPGNTELLRQKQDLLNKSIAKSEEKVKTLQAAQQELGERTKDNASQWDAIQREIIACTNEQKKWRAELDKMPGPMAQLEESAKRLSKVTGDLAQKTAGVSKAAAGVLAGAVGLAFKAGQSADDLNTLSKQYGIATDTIQRFNYAQELVDVSTETMLGSMSKLTKQIGAGNKAFEELGVSIKDANGEYRNTEDVWYDTLEALSKIDNETERDILAMELFGKSAKDLSGIIDDGGAALKALGDEAEQAGLILGQDALDAANDFNDAIDRMKSTAGAAFMEAGATLANTLLPYLERLAEVIQKALEWFGSMDAETQNFILTLVAMVAALSPALAIVSKLSGAIGNLSKVMTFLSSPMGMAVMAIGALIAAGVLLYQHWDELKAYAAELKQNLIDNFTAARDSVVGTIQTIIAWAVALPSRIANGILEQIGLVVSAAQQLGQALIDRLSTFFGAMQQVGRDLITKVKDGISSAFNGVKDFFTTIGSDIVGGIWRGIQNSIGQFTANVKGFFSGIVDSVKKDLGIQSPSKVFAYIGEMMGEGLTIGWEKAISDLNPSADVYAMATGAATAAGASYQFTNNINLNGQYHERDGLMMAMSIDKWLGERI